MLFSSLIFLTVFLPVTLFVYFIVKKELRNYILLIASLIFYAWGEPKYLSIMLIVIISNYIFGILVEEEKWKKLVISLAVLFNLSLLFYFKYCNFVITNVNKLEIHKFELLTVVMPIGISFFIFQALSYVVDVYRKNVVAQKSVYNLALYISFFPQLIAGPIVKYHDIQKEIGTREESIENIYLGLKRFSFGLGKKILLANTMGEVADKIFRLDPKNISIEIAWLGAICYSMQLYFDFSGYSDMAIGLGKVFGFNFLENFNYPYVSKSITEFWRRWHISLGSWFREYVYIPLGGNRVSKVRNYFNLFIVFLATGLWHGANWTFITWGIWHGFFIILEKRIDIEKYSSRYYKIARSVYTIIVFLVGWVIFRSENIRYAFDFLKVMFGLSEGPQVLYGSFYYVDNKGILILLISVLSSTPVFKVVSGENKNKILRLVFNIFSIVVLVLSMITIAASTYNPFIYFRF